MCKVSAKECYATGKGLKVAVRGERATAVVHVCDDRGKMYPKQIESSDNSADNVKGEVKRVEDGQYEVGYKPAS